MKKQLLIPFFLAGMALPLCLPSQEIIGANALFIGEYTDKNTYNQKGMELNAQYADEGFVLLKNDGFLPMAKGLKVSICGKSSTNLARGGAGSGAGSTSSGITAIDLQASMTNAGYEINPTLTSFYKDNNKSGSGRKNGNTGWKGISEVVIGETPMSSYTQDIIDSLDEYNDVALQVITREGSEGCDVKTCDCRDSNSDPFTEKHALELSDNEQALFDMLKEHFDHIIFIINSSNIFECEKLENDPKVSGILWIGNPGDVGPGAVGRILCGDVNPSGHTVDTWARSFRNDPTFFNFSDNAQTHKGTKADGSPTFYAADTMFAADGSPMLSYGTDKNYKAHNAPRWDDEKNKVVQGGINGVKPSAYVSYEEGIYVDYRYYETRYADMAKEDKAKADEWYAGENGVLYPFGYGLSYTTFEQKIVRVAPKKGANLTKDTDIIEVSVEVKNTGERTGKDTVQLYWRAPYEKDGIEKADHVLCAFDKTHDIEPGKTEIMHLTFHLQDVANYDYKDANNNGNTGYELDDGEYEVLLNKNAHETYDSVNYKIGEEIVYKTNRYTGYEETNRFTNNGFYSSMPGEDDIEFTEMSRADFEGTFPTVISIEDRTVGPNSRFEEFLTHEFTIGEVDTDKNFEYIPEAAYRTAEVAANWTQTGSHSIKLADMKGLDPDDPKWEEFMNEFSWSEMLTYVENNRMNSPGLNGIGKSGSSEGDGPQKFSIIWWVSSPIIAATYNTRLAHLQGEYCGMESQLNGKTGWWGPAVNTHRSPFGGRNFEYYAADPFLMGRMAANVVGAATDRGIYCYFKHFAVNDQEKNRESGISFVNEQALREIYLKSFQMVFQEGKSTGVMGSYNRCGLMETEANYMLMTEVLRNEWGFKGSVLSDMTHSGNGSVNFKCYECVTNRCIAGCNAQLDSGGFNGQTECKWDATLGGPVYTNKSGEKVISYTWWNAVRKAVKEHMYMCANATVTAKGMTPVLGQLDAEVQAREDFEFEVDPANFTLGKEVSSIENVEVNYRCDLPEGVTFENGTLSGKFAYVGTYRIDVVFDVTYTDGSSGKAAYKFVINAVPDMKDTGLDVVDPDPVDPVDPDPVDPKPGKKGCGGEIGLTSIGIASAALLGVALLTFFKKKEIEA